MSADIGAISAAGVSTIGTLATIGVVSNLANNVVRSTGHNYPRRKAPVRYSPKRVMAHRSIYSKTPRRKGYSIF